MAVEEFNQALRWDHQSVASSYLSPMAEEELGARIRKVAKEVNIVDAEVIRVQFDPDGEGADCLVEFSWYGFNDLSVRTGQEVQRWKRFGKSWLLMERMPPPEQGDKSVYLD